MVDCPAGEKKGELHEITNVLSFLFKLILMAGPELSEGDRTWPVDAIALILRSIEK